MQVTVDIHHEFYCELRAQPDFSSVPLFSEKCTSDIGQLIEEAYTHGVMSEMLPVDCESLRAGVRPIFREDLLVAKISIELTAMRNGQTWTFTQEFASGRWVRASQRKLIQLRADGLLGEQEHVYRMLIALPNRDAQANVPPLSPPCIEEATLSECGVQSLKEGSLLPHRPVLVSERFVADAIEQCIAADSMETGGAALGRIVRLSEPLPGTETRIVSILSAIVTDSRHVGTHTEFKFDPAGLLAAQSMCQLRGLQEQVVTVFHTHGWIGHCANCNQNANCALTESNPSLQDYEQLVEQLFPAKSCLLPIAGRKLGAEGRRPVLQVHAWSLGELRPIAWRTYKE